MSTTTLSHPTVSIPHFTQLVRRLRSTNARYNLIAYQCRRAQRPTYHAKQRAYRVGLRIDTSKARAAWLDAPVLVSVSAASTRVAPVSSETAGIPASVATEAGTNTDTEDRSYWSPEDTCLPNPWPKRAHVVTQKQLATRLSPLQLELCNIDDVYACQRDGPFRAPSVPGAPRWRSKPLPKECETETGRMTYGPWSPEAASTYDPVWRRVMNTHVANSVTMPVNIVYADLGITVPRRHLKRRLHDVDVDESAMFFKRRGIASVGNKYVLRV
ncbi:hypothetical protein JVT61DRAFT_6829 [Boletus reticuloceps]|uniref:Uncharacterized protein n=1 Tax=Boletus reticuloceps TaxID=495285 RepID=A0A8I3A7Q8_9AGAM|nr:hypothetical protein JVT61DRAFT_6829 [Boletus reticuloceps]